MVKGSASGWKHSEKSKAMMKETRRPRWATPGCPHVCVDRIVMVLHSSGAGYHFKACPVHGRTTFPC